MKKLDFLFFSLVVVVVVDAFITVVKLNHANPHSLLNPMSKRLFFKVNPILNLNRHCQTSTTLLKSAEYQEADHGIGERVISEEVLDEREREKEEEEQGGVKYFENETNDVESFAKSETQINPNPDEDKFEDEHSYVKPVESEDEEEKLIPPMGNYSESGLFYYMDDGEDVVETRWEYVLPQREPFTAYYRQLHSTNDTRMSRAELMQYPVLEAAMSDGVIVSEEIDQLWEYSSGDMDSVDEKEGFDLLCMVMDLQDPDMAGYLDQQFDQLSDQVNFNIMKKKRDKAKQARERHKAKVKAQTGPKRQHARQHAHHSHHRPGLHKESQQDERLEKKIESSQASRSLSSASSVSASLSARVDGESDNEEGEEEEGERQRHDIDEALTDTGTGEEGEGEGDISLELEQEEEQEEEEEEEVEERGVTFTKFLSWNRIQEMMNAGLISDQEIASVWIKEVQGGSSLASRQSVESIDVAPGANGVVPEEETETETEAVNVLEGVDEYVEVNRRLFGVVHREVFTLAETRVDMGEEDEAEGEFDDD